MRLRDISELIGELVEDGPDALFGSGPVHPLVEDIQEVQTLYRPVAPNPKKEVVLPWLTFGFQPYRGLLEPFSVYPGRLYAMVRMHKQPSGLPELVTHIRRDLPDSEHLVYPDLYTSFSNSPRVETKIKREGTDPARLRFFHTGGMMEADRTHLSPEFCIPGFQSALGEGSVEDQLPGVVDLDGTPTLYLGDLVFYNQFRTVDRPHLVQFILHNVAAAVVGHYVRDVVRKSMAEAEAAGSAAG
jgi:hypothetical protein